MADGTAISCVAILSPGDMGHGVGAALRARGFDVVTCLGGRSERSRGLAAKAGMRDITPLADMVEAADIILSILPPAAAVAQAERVAAALRERGIARAYADCNAISPRTMDRVAGIIRDAGSEPIDASIIGSAPGRGPMPTRFYVSGPAADLMAVFGGDGISVRSLGPEIGRASAMKMVYAGMTKGTNALYVAVHTLAEALGLSDELRAELTESQPDALRRAEAAIPRLPADAGRWIGEMDEIAATYRAAGVTAKFHEGAADIYRLLESTPFAAETRETLDRSRTLAQSVRVFADHLPKRAAE